MSMKNVQNMRENKHTKIRKYAFFMKMYFIFFKSSLKFTLQLTIKCFFKLSKVKFLRLSLKISLYVEKDRSASHDVAGQNLNIDSSAGESFLIYSSLVCFPCYNTSRILTSIKPSISLENRVHFLYVFFRSHLLQNTMNSLDIFQAIG